MGATGVHSYQELRSQGLTRAAIRTLLEVGTLEHAARGWYATTHADRSVCAALKAGGRLGCLSGCQHHGLWVPPHAGIHVVHGAGARPRPTPGLVIHPDPAPQPRDPVWPVLDCVRQVARRHGVEDAMVVAESAINLRLLDVAQAREALGSLPLRHAHYRGRLAAAESGSETRVRLFFERRRIPVRPQHLIGGVGRVDLIVGDRLIVECDSEAHHGRTNYEVDRRRDLNARNLGYDTIRLSYQQIWNLWPSTQHSLLQAVRRRRHITRRTQVFR